MSLLEINNINMNYHSPKKTTEALCNINFYVEEGEFISIVGPSGCGKSTLLNIICGLLKPSSGKIFLNDTEILEPSIKMGYMFQKDHLFPWLSVWSNIILGLKIKGGIKPTDIERIEGLIDTYGLSEWKDHKPSELSGGMRQRAALIRTLALDPDILLLDEPFSALDAHTRVKVSDDIYRIIKKEKKTALMVTHDISEAVACSSKVIVLTKRPASINNIVKINFPKEFDTPLERRKHSSFKDYFNLLWEELDYDEK